MHSYLSAIGFRQLNKKSGFKKLLETIKTSPDFVKIVPMDEESNFALYAKEVEEGIGVALYGETDCEGNFQMEYHFPYILSDTCSTTEECTIKRQIEKEAYNGFCDDLRIGLNLIFYLNNFMDYHKECHLREHWPNTKGVCLSALSIQGKILMPIQKNKKQLEAFKKESSHNSKLMEAARDGDQEAMEDLAVWDMNLYAQVSKRLVKQDIYSVVETYFMPTGMECDQYSIMGYITSCKKTSNRMTGEKLYVMELLCNDIPIKLCINEADLIGMPKAGYRFKGDIWLQGKGIFDSKPLCGKTAPL